ncbi:hypothetical protein D3C71_2144530 [compost metagenome]
MGEAERGVERAGALVGRGRALLLQFVFDALHGEIEIAGHAGPVGGVDAGLAIERIDAKAAIV